MWRRGDGWWVSEWRVSNTCAWHIVCAVGLRFGVAKPQYILLLTTRCEKKIGKKIAPKLDLNPVPPACEPSVLPSELWEGVERPSHTCKASVN